MAAAGDAWPVLLLREYSDGRTERAGQGSEKSLAVKFPRCSRKMSPRPHAECSWRFGRTQAAPTPFLPKSPADRPRCLRNRSLRCLGEWQPGIEQGICVSAVRRIEHARHAAHRARLFSTREREKTCFCGNLFALRQLFPRRQREKGRLAEGCRFKHRRGGRRKRCFRRTESAMTGQVFVHAQQRAPARAWKAGPETVPRKGGPVVPTFPAVCSFSWPGTPTHGRRNGVSPGGIGDPRRRA